MRRPSSRRFPFVVKVVVPKATVRERAGTVGWLVEKLHPLSPRNRPVGVGLLHRCPTNHADIASNIMGYSPIEYTAQRRPSLIRGGHLLPPRLGRGFNNVLHVPPTSLTRPGGRIEAACAPVWLHHYAYRDPRVPRRRKILEWILQRTLEWTLEHLLTAGYCTVPWPPGGPTPEHAHAIRRT